MKRNKLNLRRGLALSLLVLSISACSSNDKNTSNGNGGGSGNTTTPVGGTPPPPVVVTPNQEDKFGANFGAAFRAALNGEPISVNDGDIIPISLTAEPEVVN